MTVQLSRRDSLMLTASAAGCVLLGRQPARAAGALDRVSMTFDWVLDGLYAPFFLGVDTGIFAKHGIELTLFPGTGSRNTALAVASGHSTFGIVDATVIPSAVLQGAEIKTFCCYMRTTAFGICYKKNSGIKQPKDLEGKTYGDAPGSATYALWPVFMRKVGADPSKVRLISVSPAAQWSGFFDGQYLATFTAMNDSFVKVSHGGHDVAAFAYADYGINLMSKTLVAEAATLKNTDLVRRFSLAFLESLEATRRDPAAAIDVTRRVAPQSSAKDVQLGMLQDTFAHRLDSPNTIGQPPGRMADKDWTDLVETLAEVGVLKQRVPIGQLFTNEFLPG